MDLFNFEAKARFQEADAARRKARSELVRARAQLADAVRRRSLLGEAGATAASVLQASAAIAAAELALAEADFALHQQAREIPIS